MKRDVGLLWLIQTVIFHFVFPPGPFMAEKVQSYQAVLNGMRLTRPYKGVSVRQSVLDGLIFQSVSPLIQSVKTVRSFRRRHLLILQLGWLP